MVFREMVPWKKDKSGVRVRSGDEEYPLLSLQHRMNRMFDDFFGDWSDFPLSPFRALGRVDGGYWPRMDVTETEKEVTITAELAGLDEKDVEITLQDNVLTLKGEKKTEREEKEANRYLAERSYGSFCRSIELPAEVEQDKIDAVFRKGILTVRLPKIPVEETKAKKIEIKAE